MIIEAAKEQYPNAQSIEWDFKVLKVDGVIIDHESLKPRELALKQIATNEVDKRNEREWIDSELAKVRDLIEDAEDTKTLATKLRAYRQALKQYKSDLYMPNVSRPRL